MRKSTPPILFTIAALWIASLACGLPGIPVTGPTVGTIDPNALGTAIMQTAIAAASQTASVSTAVVPVEIVNTPVPTSTLEPTLTLSPTVTLTPLPLFTSTPLVPLISVSKDTNCRVGPGKDYDRVGGLMIGETAEIVGRDPTGRYWYIKNPDQSNGYCWLWTEYATISGNTSVLPVYTPPPTPTPAPNFEAEYDELEDCAGWWVNIQLTNTGGITFKSISMTVEDLKLDAHVSLYADKFTELDGCRDSSTKDVLNPGERFTVSSPAFADDPDGHKMRVTVSLCSLPGQNGACVTKTIKFTP